MAISGSILGRRSRRGRLICSISEKKERIWGWRGRLRTGHRHEPAVIWFRQAHIYTWRVLMQDKDRHGETSLIFRSSGQTADILHVAISRYLYLIVRPAKQTETWTFAIVILREEQAKHITLAFVYFGGPENFSLEDPRKKGTIVLGSLYKEADNTLVSSADLWCIE